MRNLPKVQQGKTGRRKKHGISDDFCELIINEIEVNESVENAK